MPREKLGSRLGFILLSAGCAIGVGNVWKFPWLVGQYGGGAFVLMATGRFEGLDTDGVSAVFPEMLGNPWVLGAWTVVVILAGFAINSFGLQGGLERVTKGMMLALLAIMVVLAANRSEEHTS